MAGIIGIYGLVVSVLISDGLKQKLSLYEAFIQLGAGLSVGLSGLAAGSVLPLTTQPELSIPLNRKILTRMLYQVRNRHRRRRRRPRHRTATPSIRRHDPDPHFR